MNAIFASALHITAPAVVRAVASVAFYFGYWFSRARA